jgi:HAD superfamily hydrolase (TIGR01662 family)
VVVGVVRVIRGVLFDLGDTIIVEARDPGAPILEWMRLRRVPYAATLIRRLAKRYRLAVVSNTKISGMVEVREALRRVGLLSYFDAVVTSVDVGCEKPGREIFLYALDALGVKPSEAVMIGDRVDTDIQGANRMGITTILHRWRNRYPVLSSEGFYRPSYSVSSLREVEGVLDQIESARA